MTPITFDSEDIHRVLGQYILTDGFHIAIDLKKSHGSWIVDAVSGREILDFYSYFATLPIGHNHPALTQDEAFNAALTRAAIANPSNADIYSAEYAGFVDRFARLAKPDDFRYMFLQPRGATARR